MKLAPEGWIYIIPSLIVTAIAILLQQWVAAIVLGLLTLFLLNFFRDPTRTTEGDALAVISPADGTVVVSRDIEDPPREGLTKMISIFMSVVDVHVNRAPVSGEIIDYEYFPGKKGGALYEKASAENEQNLIVMRADDGRVIAFKQIAGLLARRIVFDLKKGDRVSRGDRIGMIKFGSRVDVFLPAEAEIQVSLKDKVRVGETVIAVFPGEGS